jgi:hypothetical protein
LDRIIDVTTDKLGYSIGENVSLTITNICDEKIDGNPQFDIFDESGTIVFSLRIYLWLELNPGETWFWEWNQLDKNGYQVSNGRFLLEGRLHAYDETYIDHALFYIGENSVPSTPTIDGPTSGRVGVKYDYKFLSIDPDDDLIWYYICWGDLEIIRIYGPYHSGEEVTLSYIYRDKGTWTIQCKAVDSFDASSDWAYLEVTMPRVRLFNGRLLQFYEYLVDQFPIFKILFSSLLKC